jgi:hypothetical protein
MVSFLYGWLSWRERQQPGRECSQRQAYLILSRNATQSTLQQGLLVYPFYRDNASHSSTVVCANGINLGTGVCISPSLTARIIYNCRTRKTMARKCLQGWAVNTPQSTISREAMPTACLMQHLPRQVGALREMISRKKRPAPWRFSRGMASGERTAW